MEKDRLLSLAARCEAASGPDRDLDGEIVVAVFGWTFEKRKGDAKPYWRKAGVTEYYMREMSGPPCYTASLDAALSLAIPSWCVDMRRCDDGATGYAEIRSSDMTPDGAADELYVEARAATLPLALTAAALRARA